MNKKFVHVCEVCGKTKVMTSEEAYMEGWDYPPYMGTFGVVSPRTCSDCMMIDTVWWALVNEKKTYNELTEKQKETIRRIQREPLSIMPGV